MWQPRVSPCRPHWGSWPAFWIALHRPEELGARVTTIQFAEAIGICAYVTALPVLGAILREMGLLGRRMGSLALAIAGVHVALLWILLGLLLWGLAGQTSEGPGVFASLIVLPVYLAVMATTLARLVLAQEIGQQALKKALTFRNLDSKEVLCLDFDHRYRSPCPCPPRSRGSRDHAAVPALGAADVREKTSAIDLVTQADEAAECFIKAECARLFPTATFIGEEWLPPIRLS